MNKTQRHTSKGWTWIPTLYFAEGLPYVAVMTIAVILYKRMGLSNAEIALYTSWLYLPWTLKPLWSPLIDLLGSKRKWILSMEMCIAASLAGIAFFIPTDYFLQVTLAFFWLLAFSSATHDIAADGFYMLGLSEKEQSFFVGIRNTFYRFSTIFGQGILVMLAGVLEKYYGNIPLAWSLTFYLLTAIFIILWGYHRFKLPHPTSDQTKKEVTFNQLMKDFGNTFVSFFQNPEIGLALFFLLTYRLGEAQLAKIASVFLLDSPEAGGLGMSTTEVGMIYGTIGVIALLIGGILGGWVVSKQGFKKWIIPMALAINIPDLLYIWMAAVLPHSTWIVGSCVAIEQLGYGFGFTAYTLYLIRIAKGTHQTSHYAIGTGLMALGMMIPGMPAGWLQEAIGYSWFFIWVCISTLPGIYAAYCVKKRL